MNFLYPTITLLSVASLSFAQEAGKETLPLSKYPAPEEALSSMKKATSFFRTNLSFAGGYARAWSRDLKEVNSENQTDPTVISIQPHGTTTIGLTMWRAHDISQDPLFLQGAKEVAQALAWTQLASGGWGADHRFNLRDARRLHYRRDLEAGDDDPGNRRRRSSLDDNKSQSAIRFLMHYANSPAGEDNSQLQNTLQFAWDGLLGAQAPNGGWPQMFSNSADPELPVKPAAFPEEWSRTHPRADYTVFYTLNDNNLYHIAMLLLEAHEISADDDDKFINALKRLGDFLLLAQMPDPQPVWAQQYDFEMHPAWARKFEPPSVCSIESLGAMKTLVEIWLATGDEKYISSLPKALDWFQQSRLSGGRENEWARFYELKTNKPLYCRAETYELTYDDSNLPTHYGFIVGSSMNRSLDRIREMIETPRDQILAKRKRDSAPPDSMKEWAEEARDLAGKARYAMTLQKKEGYWVNDDNQIDAGEYVKRMNALMDYVEAAEAGGEIFEKICTDQWKKEQAELEAQKAKAAAGKQPSSKN